MDTKTSNAVSTVEKLLIIIAIIGAVNWGLIGFFNFNLVDAIFGGGTAEETSRASRVVYAIVGLAGLAAAALLPTLRRPRVDETSYAGHPGRAS
ncbi:MAG TPA: DUF378 domain-containing protein [Kofleriaceae bacterium]|nr:DUF378 domain-containing protein [Kofleriaceae bacterium]